MRKTLKVLFVTSALVAGIAGTSVLDAHDPNGSQGSMMGPGMMGQGGMMGGGSMMSQMNTMMENCNKMMQGMMDRGGQEAPNDQWRKGEPRQPEKKG